MGLGGKSPPSGVGRLVGRAPAVGATWSSRELDRFVAGATNGETLLHALYDEVLDEPVPVRLSTLMKQP
jgi:hypothetical protein